MRETLKVERLIEPSVMAMGFRLVRVGFTTGGRPTLQIMAEPLDGRPMTVEDCAQLSRQISAVLDVEDPIPAAYTLEVSSPGIDRPLLNKDDYRRFAGFEARIEMGQGIDGRKKFRGIIEPNDRDDEVTLADQSVGMVILAMADIAKAKLVLTDELIAATEEHRIPPPSVNQNIEEAEQATA